MSAQYVYPLAMYRTRKTSRDILTAGQTAMPYSTRPDLDEELGEMFRLSDERAGELLLVRHAEPDTGTRHRYCGDEPALTITGRVQAHYLAGRLTEGSIDAVYSSPERYAVETARMISEVVETPMRVLSDLADVGYTEGAGAGNGIAGRLFAANPCWDALPGFEASTPFRRRVIQTIEGLLAAHGAERIVVVTHASVINAYLSMLLDIPRDLFFYPDYASLNVVRWHQDLYALRSLNDTTHVTTVSPPWPAPREV